MTVLSIVRVNELPVTYQANKLYFVKGEGELMDIYLSNADGSAVSHLHTQEETLGQIVHFASAPPVLPSKTPLWWDVTEGSLYVQYNDGVSTAWVEAMPSIVVPEFAGTGTADTMARSDHHHDETYVKVGAHEW